MSVKTEAITTNSRIITPLFSYLYLISPVRILKAGC